MKLNKYLNKANLKECGIYFILTLTFLFIVRVIVPGTALGFEDVLENIDVNIELISYAVAVIVFILINIFKPKLRADIFLIIASILYIIYYELIK